MLPTPLEDADRSQPLAASWWETADLALAAPGVDVPPDLAPVVISRDQLGIAVSCRGTPCRAGRADRAVLVRAGGLLVATVDLEAAVHPELTLALADVGVDLIVVCAEDAGPGDVDRVLLRCLDRTAVAVVTARGAQLQVPPPDHGAPQARCSRSPIQVTLSGGWSTHTGGHWDPGSTVDWEALCRSVP